jgi:glycosyltransferase involved in cell wall biosynthesis
LAVTPRYPDLALSVVMPAYNEEQNLARVLPRAVESLRRMVGKYEILLIDDCSRDRTAEVAAEMAARYPEVVVIENQTNLRQGPTLAKGFRLARYDLVTHNAVDYPFDFDDLPDLLDQFPEADVVVARRRTYPGVTRPRRFVSFVHRSLIRMMFGTHFHDYNFIQIYKRSVLEELPTACTSTPFITPEKIIRAHRGGRRVVEVEVDYHPRLVGTPSSANCKNIRTSLAEMARLWWDLRS